MSVISQTQNTTVLIYNGGISLAPGDNIHTIVTITNHSIWSTDNSLYYQYAPIQYWDVEQGMVKCPSMNDSCQMNVFDGNGWYEIPLMLNGQELDADLTVFMNFDQGTVYNNDFGLMFDPNTFPCSSMETFVIVGPAYNMIFYYCCNSFKYVTVPDEDMMCTEFKGTSTLNDASGNALSSITANYRISPLGIRVNVTNAVLSTDGNYDLNPNDDTNGCNGNANSPNCNLFYEIEDPSLDYQVDMILYFGQGEETTIGTTIAGKITKRGQVILHDQNQPYTKANPCWNGTYLASQSKNTAVNSLCCTKFEKPPSGTTCAEYQSVTQVYQQQGRKEQQIDDANVEPYLQVKYQFNNSSFVVSILNFTNGVKSNVQFESYSTDTFSQICKATTDSPTNNCTFKLSNTNQYEFKFRTSDMADGFDIISVNEVQSQILDPFIIPANPCVTKYNYDASQSFVAVSQLCCIAEANGPWPGSMKAASVKSKEKTADRKLNKKKTSFKAIHKTFH
uniref:Uncharacterized protein n=1 Tax=Panagrolaimus sp. PS1159 TaxID=55785 RepID=A0AC35GI73_9BILA